MSTTTDSNKVSTEGQAGAPAGSAAPPSVTDDKQAPPQGQATTTGTPGKTDDPPAPPASIDDQIRAYNEKVTGDDDTVSDEPAVDEPGDGDDDTGSGEFQFTENADLDTFLTEADQALENVDLSGAPEVLAVIDRLKTEVTTLRSQSFEAFGGKEEVEKVLTPFQRIYETIEEGGSLEPNVKPLVEFMTKEYANELPVISRELFMQDSRKYQGLSLFQEVLTDAFPGTTPEKLNQINAFLQANTPLPIPKVDRPAFLDEKLEKAWAKIPEVKRFQIETLAAEIEQLEADLPDVSSYGRKEAEDRIGQKRAELAAEMQMVQDAQAGIDARTENEQRAQRQQAEARAKFERDTYSEYMTENAGLMDQAAKELAPKLDYLDEGMQMGFARNMMARVGSALAFIINDDGSFGEDAMAEYYAKQMKEEGVEFDFNKGRELLQKQYKQKRIVAALKADRNASPKAVEAAEKTYRQILSDIAAERIDLIGQLATKTVNSSNNALKKKAENLQKKKAVSRVTPRGAGAGTGQKQSLSDIDREIARHNASVKNGDDLYNLHS